MVPRMIMLPKLLFLAIMKARLPPVTLNTLRRRVVRGFRQTFRGPMPQGSVMGYRVPKLRRSNYERRHTRAVSRDANSPIALIHSMFSEHLRKFHTGEIPQRSCGLGLLLGTLLSLPDCRTCAVVGGALAK